MENYTLELSDSSEPVPAIDTPSEPTESAPVEEGTPSPTPTVETKTDELLDLPDGRKVTTAEAMREWKDNFMPDYTRKSQELAEMKRAGESKVTPPKDEKQPWQDPDYAPQTYAEIVEYAKAEAVKAIEQKALREQTAIQETKSRVENEISEIKKLDPSLDENLLFTHANKYGFNNLKAAHTNMVDLKHTILEVEQRTLKNIKLREANPVAGSAGKKTTDPYGDDINITSKFSNAAEYLEFLQKK